MSLEDYRKALRLGKKAYRSRIMRGECPYLPVLQQLLHGVTVTAQVPLGTLDIPIEQIVGTHYPGRQPTFSYGFYPLMPEDSEFAQKWIALCQAHLSEEGIRDPIQVYEYINRFYIVEGHKRVSVLRFFHVNSIRASVTRIIPKLDNSTESHIYAEFLQFYQVTGINYLWFSMEGDFPSLLQRTYGEECWIEEQRTQFRSFYNSFRAVYSEKASKESSVMIGDAILIYLNIHDYSSSLEKPLATLRMEVQQLRNEFLSYSKSKDAEINLILTPNDHKSFFTPRFPSPLRVAFIYDEPVDKSSWIYSHELGRRDLEATLGWQIETVPYMTTSDKDVAVQTIEEAIANSCDLIFTTSPRLLQASVKAALAYPKANILNCSLNTAHVSIRTYYSRMYEAKFLMGMIAGSLAEDGRIGYLADYPIYGISANINAFALGAKMVNPRAQIDLQWSHTQQQDGRDHFFRSGISYVSDRDILSADGKQPRYVGLYHSDGKNITNLALSVCHWGKLYEKIIRSYWNGGWKSDAADTRAINYWWGMDSEMIDLICSRSLPQGTSQLIYVISDAIRSGNFHPFSGIIRTQDDQLLDYHEHTITPEEIITMDWLADNVLGSFPQFDELLPEAQALVRIQGIQKP